MALETLQFIEPGVLIDRELELVVPEARWIGDLLTACQHPLSRRLAPFDAGRTRQELLQFIQAFPNGHQYPDESRQIAPAYHFWMRLRPGFGCGVPMAGSITLRLGHSEDLCMYLGHIGYGVLPPARGNHYAERACRLLFPLAAAHDLSPLWVTCNPDNYASRRTCERLGMTYVDTVQLPEKHFLAQRGEREKCRYRLDLPR